MNILPKFCYVLVIFCFFNLCQFHSTDLVYNNYLGTRTPYRFIANENVTRIEYNGCKAKKIWMIIRHGTRNPSRKVIETMNSKLPLIKNLILNELSESDYLSDKVLNNFKLWMFHLTKDDDSKLTHEGEEEMLLLAERMQLRFPELFDNIYSNTSYKFKYTHSQRTKRSAKYFATGLFGKSAAKDVWYPKPLDPDPILRFYKLCGKWKEQKAKLKKNGEHKIFSNSSYVSEVVESINKQLGLSRVLDLSEIYAMYLACGFETAWSKGDESPWCSIFNEKHLKVLEYIDDLKYYWIDGYGHELTYKQACKAFDDMVNYFNNLDSFPKATVYFTHSGTLLKMLAHLGLYKDDEPLRTNNFEKMANRKWKTSLIDTFGTNLAFVLYDCAGTMKLLTLHQEKPVRLSICPNFDLCDYSEIIEYYKDSIDSCDFNLMCTIQ